MKTVIVGGHLSPALAVIEKLKGEEVFYIGRKHVFEGDKALSPEYQELEKLQLPFFALNTGRLQRKFTRHTIFSLTKIPFGFANSVQILRKIKPDVVLGFGGYLFLPVAFAARFLNIPVVLHEQTLEAGFTNKLVSKFAKKVCISWQSSESFFPKEKIVLTGNPLRKEIIDIKKAKQVENPIPVIYITGGGSGAHAVNVLVEKSLDRLLQKYSIIHQTGWSEIYRDFESLDKIKNKNYKCQKFLSEKQAALAIQKADLVVGRSGINIVTELIYLGKPAFLIPIPVGQNNEQLRNAQFIKSLGLGDYAEQYLLTPDTFVSHIESMLTNIKNYKLNRELIFEDAAGRKIVEVLKDVSKKA
jgi:UDP-N-acetylglucosamine--N-acetylmuramyl-(pentapeptide) pyrophosphoryl-undecaprenol N-acetylglucosamine transferase